MAKKNWTTFLLYVECRIYWKTCERWITWKCWLSQLYIFYYFMHLNCIWEFFGWIPISFFFFLSSSSYFLLNNILFDVWWSIFDFTFIRTFPAFYSYAMLCVVNTNIRCHFSVFKPFIIENDCQHHNQWPYQSSLWIFLYYLQHFNLFYINNNNNATDLKAHQMWSMSQK